jgi:hypothetical protein
MFKLKIGPVNWIIFIFNLPANLTTIFFLQVGGIVLYIVREEEGKDWEGAECGRNFV